MSTVTQTFFYCNVGHFCKTNRLNSIRYKIKETESEPECKFKRRTTTYRQRTSFHLLCRTELPYRMECMLVCSQRFVPIHLKANWTYREVRSKRMKLKPGSKILNSRMKEILHCRPLCPKCFSCFYYSPFWHLFAFFVLLLPF